MKLLGNYKEIIPHTRSQVMKQFLAFFALIEGNYLKKLIYRL